MPVKSKPSTVCLRLEYLPLRSSTRVSSPFAVTFTVVNPISALYTRADRLSAVCVSVDRLPSALSMRAVRPSAVCMTADRPPSAFSTRVRMPAAVCWISDRLPCASCISRPSVSRPCTLSSSRFMSTKRSISVKDAV